MAPPHVLPSPAKALKDLVDYEEQCVHFVHLFQKAKANGLPKHEREEQEKEQEDGGTYLQNLTTIAANALLKNVREAKTKLELVCEITERVHNSREWAEGTSQDMEIVADQLLAILVEMQHRISMAIEQLDGSLNVVIVGGMIRDVIISQEQSL
jgi:hypothetical protein